MKKTICKRDYDTETATLVQKYVSGALGDPAGFEECLYRTPEGLYFIYGRGGEASPYPAEGLQRLAKAKLNDWLKAHPEAVAV